MQNGSSQEMHKKKIKGKELKKSYRVVIRKHLKKASACNDLAWNMPHKLKAN